MKYYIFNLAEPSNPEIKYGFAREDAEHLTENSKAVAIALVELDDPVVEADEVAVISYEEMTNTFFWKGIKK